MDCFSVLQGNWSPPPFSIGCVYSGILEAGVRPGAAANGNMDMLLVSQWRHGHSAPVSQWPQSFHQRQKRWIPHTSDSHGAALLTWRFSAGTYFLIKSKYIVTGSQVTITAVRRVWVALIVVVHGGTSRHICERRSKAKKMG